MRFLLLSILLLPLMSNAQEIREIKIPGTDSVMVIDITKIREEAEKVAEEARMMAAEQQEMQMEVFIEAFGEDSDFKDFREKFEKFQELKDFEVVFPEGFPENIEVDAERIEECIRVAQIQLEAQQEEMERAMEKAYTSNIQYEKNFFYSYKVDYEGDIKLNDKEDDIISISEGGKFVVEKRTFGNLRKLVIQPSSTGELTYKYYEGNKLMPFKPDGENWLNDVLPEVIKSNAIAAEDRIDRQIKSGGVSGTLNYISSLDGNSAKTTFYRILLNHKKVKNSDITSITDAVVKNITTSFELEKYFKSTFATYYNKKMLNAYFNGIKEIKSSTSKENCLINVVSRKEFQNGFSKENMNAWVDAYVSLTSSFGKRKVYSRALKNGIHQFYPTDLERILQNISSDFDLRMSIEKSFIDDYFKNWSDAQIITIINQTQRISSSFDHAQALMKISEQWDTLSKGAKLAYLESSKDITSAFELRKALAFYSVVYEEDESIKKLYYGALKNISSDFDLKSALSKAMKSPSFNAKDVTYYLDASKSISSSFDKKGVLMSIAPFVNLETAPLFFEETAKISSAFDKKSVFLKMIDQDNFTYEFLPHYLKAASTISSSFELSTVLREAAPYVVASKNEEYKNQYVKVAKGISSSDYRNEVLGALYE
ncbi:hypothetical protein MY04_5485 [Flammeovirga sp. MY04]|uniref:hypothetical protein n=1 Tax=Flammeovirga sp. MY04 TaxID=1191459 RepID=UPI0008061A0D|nr:hypothetical protein [Flammeovirga sp. MY04]ANQ52816.1 hypothetical protein MY04_5485 [Flammeovirga sp. MY04]